MNLTINILRPEDLLVLTIETQNLKLETKDPKNPRLVVDQASTPAYLIVTFPPQSIAEEAFFEAASPGSSDSLLPAGSVQARMAGPSRLVFKLPKNVTIPYQTTSLLKWTGLDLVVSATAQGASQPSIPQPQPTETAIEIPYRLVLSPGTGVTWVNSMQPVVHAGRVELWHTRLAHITKSKNAKGVTTTSLREASPEHTISLRAIWSPDFTPGGALPSPALETPFTLAALSPNDRAQIVILTSGTEGYVVLGANNSFTPYKPSPVNASRFFLSSLGGWLTSLGRWPGPPQFTYYKLRGGVLHPASGAAKPLAKKAKISTSVTKLGPTVTGPAPVVTVPRPPIIGQPTTVQLDVIEWSHLATQGRDHYVRVVYEGYLYPFGHRASLVKVTERKFVAPDDPKAPQTGYSVTAYLRQHMYIVVRDKELSYDISKYLNQGREMPFYKRIRIDTMVTPDIDKPVYLDLNDANFFWINVDSAPFQFHVTATDLAGASIDFLAPMMFVTESVSDLGAISPATSDANSVQSFYQQGTDAQRACIVKGKKIAFADPSKGDTIFKTTSLYFDAQILATAGPAFPPPPGLPFMPILTKAVVTIPSLEEMLGVATPIEIEYYQPYLVNGFDAFAGVFAQLDPSTPVSVGFTAQQSGGFATPYINVQGLSARKGVISGSPANALSNAATGVFDPTDFFPLNTNAYLFGTIPLGQLIEADSPGQANFMTKAPEIRTKASPNIHQPTEMVTKITWSPPPTDFNPSSGVPVAILFDQMGQTSKLSLNASITRFLNGSPGGSSVKGELTNFQLQMLQVINLQVNSITFASTNGSKTKVSVKLPKSDAIKFVGPLGFLQQLATILPPGIFGGQGPSIKLTSTDIKVSFTLGIPPISIGVFTLEHIAITTGVDLPYLNGQPAFEFAFSSRSKPCLLTVECLGGGGFVHVVLNASGIQMVEAALEFGGMFSLDLGVASGGVSIMAGIYFQLAGSLTTITGFVDISGEVSVLEIISISIDLNLSLSWNSNGKIEGKATLTVSVSVLFFSISVQLSVERSFGSSSGDPRVVDVVTADDWAAYALAFAA